MTGTATLGVDVTLGDGVDVTAEGEVDVTAEDGDVSCTPVADVEAVPPGGAADFPDSPGDVLHAVSTIAADASAVALQTLPVRGPVIATPSSPDAKTLLFGAPG
jgi:hypothetical protein